MSEDVADQASNGAQQTEEFPKLDAANDSSGKEAKELVITAISFVWRSDANNILYRSVQS